MRSRLIHIPPFSVAFGLLLCSFVPPLNRATTIVQRTPTPFTLHNIASHLGPSPLAPVLIVQPPEDALCTVPPAQRSPIGDRSAADGVRPSNFLAGTGWNKCHGRCVEFTYHSKSCPILCQASRSPAFKVRRGTRPLHYFGGIIRLQRHRIATCNTYHIRTNRSPLRWPRRFPAQVLGQAGSHFTGQTLQRYIDQRSPEFIWIQSKFVCTRF